jgi:hypothetical protein
MRISVRVAIILVIFSGHALAKGKKGADAAKSGAGMMDSNDPADKETSDKGPYAPPQKSEQAEAKEKKEKEAEVLTEEHDNVKRRPRDKFGLFGNVVIGFGRPPEPGTSTGSDGDSNATNKGTSFTFMAGGYYDVSPQFSLGLRIPWTTASQRQIDGSYGSAQALGAPELMGEYRVILSPRTNLPIDFGVGIPVAQGGYDTVGGAAQYRQTVVNDMADAASGYRDGELFSPKRLPLILGVGIDYERKELSLHAATKFVAGFKVGGSLNYGTLDQGIGTYELKSVTFRNVTSAGIGYQFLGKPALSAELDSWIATNAVSAVEFNSNAGATGPNRIQVVAEPRVKARFGKISPSLGYIFPLGGRLADNHTSGLELHCDVAF